MEDLISAQVKAETNILRQLNDLLALFEPWTPTQNSDLVPNHPLYMFQRGQVNPDIRIINGFVKDEGLMFIYEALGSSVSKLEYAALVPVLLGLKPGSKIVSHYPVKGDDARPTLSQLASDALFHCPGRSVASSIAGDTWLYQFDHAMSFYGNGSFGGTQPWCAGHTCHAGELPFMFFPDNLPAVLDDHANYTQDEVILGDAINRYWGSFANSGQPGTGSSEAPLEWLPFSAGSGRQLQFTTPANQLAGDMWADKCSFFDTLGYPWIDDTDSVIVA